MPLPRRLRRRLVALPVWAVTALVGVCPALAVAQGPQPSAGEGAPVVEAREAFRKKDRARLAALRGTLVAAQNPLAAWVEYWELNNRLAEASVDEVEAFYARWRGSYVEDRLRDDWLLELGRRRDWASFARDFPRFRMNDDREVTCYALLTEHLAGHDVRDAARAAWAAQRADDDGCTLLATTLAQARVLGADDLWRKARLAVEQGRPRSARVAALLAEPRAAHDIDEALDQPARFLRKREGHPRGHGELTVLALLRAAASDAGFAAGVLDDGLSERLTHDQAAWAWAFIGRQSAQQLSADGAAQYQRAWALLRKSERARPGWSDDTLAWAARAALRVSAEGERWPMVLRAIDAMSPTQRQEPVWKYWRARALRATAPEGSTGDAQRAEARFALQSISSPLDFYGKLATEELGQTAVLPAPALPPTAQERTDAQAHPGLARALQLIALGLRSEGVREWNFSLRGMGERELLAAAQLACDRAVWDRCINTSDRTRLEVDLAQRFPMPFREQVVAKARDLGLDPAYVYGLIRQESRFVTDARSSVGASGLMQIMPATARWTARKIGVAYTQGAITDRDTNLRLGTAYLKLLLDDFGGSQALAAAAYNAGPSRPRRWRDGPLLEPAIWAENVPFAETRDYVKKVLSNAALYAALLDGHNPRLKDRLGQTIGPREASAAPFDPDLP